MEQAESFGKSGFAKSDSDNEDDVQDRNSMDIPDVNDRLGNVLDQWIDLCMG